MDSGTPSIANATTPRGAVGLLDGGTALEQQPDQSWISTIRRYISVVILFVAPSQSPGSASRQTEDRAQLQDQSCINRPDPAAGAGMW
ncbi:hypothetical protein [Rhizobacter sp. P5_C2]